MNTIRKHAGTQGDTIWVVTLALLAVLAYSLWGAYLLRSQRLGEARQGTAVALTGQADTR